MSKRKTMVVCGLRFVWNDYWKCWDQLRRIQTGHEIECDRLADFEIEQGLELSQLRAQLAAEAWRPIDEPGTPEDGDCLFSAGFRPEAGQWDHNGNAVVDGYGFMPAATVRRRYSHWRRTLPPTREGEE